MRELVRATTVMAESARRVCTKRPQTPAKNPGNTQNRTCAPVVSAQEQRTATGGDEVVKHDSIPKLVRATSESSIACGGDGERREFDSDKPSESESRSRPESESESESEADVLGLDGLECRTNVRSSCCACGGHLHGTASTCH